MKFATSFHGHAHDAEGPYRESEYCATAPGNNSETVYTYLLLGPRLTPSHALPHKLGYGA